MVFVEEKMVRYRIYEHLQQRVLACMYFAGTAAAVHRISQRRISLDAQHAFELKAPNTKHRYDAIIQRAGECPYLRFAKGRTDTTAWFYRYSLYILKVVDSHSFECHGNKRKKNRYISLPTGRLLEVLPWA